MTTTGGAEPSEQTRLLYVRAVFDGDDGALAAADRILDGAEAALSLARGPIVHARFLAQQRETERETSRASRRGAVAHGLSGERG